MVCFELFYLFLSYSSQVLPVFLKALPLKEDREESIAVFTCICHLVVASNSQVFVSYPNLKNWLDCVV